MDQLRSPHCGQRCELGPACWGHTQQGYFELIMPQQCQGPADGAAEGRVKGWFTQQSTQVSGGEGGKQRDQSEGEGEGGGVGGHDDDRTTTNAAAATMTIRMTASGW